MGRTEENQRPLASEATPFDSELIFALEDRPPVLIAFFAAMFWGLMWLMHPTSSV